MTRNTLPAPTPDTPYITTNALSVDEPWMVVHGVEYSLWESFGDATAILHACVVANHMPSTLNHMTGRLQ